MNLRLKEIRNTYELSQKEFGAKLCLSQDHISSLENGRRKITDRTINDICDKFNIEEKWLRFGEGKMKKNLVDEIDAPDEIKILLNKFFLLSKSDQKKLEIIIDSFIEEEQKKEEEF